MAPDTPPHQIRALQDGDDIAVYQAYSPHIAGPAVAAQTFVPPFKMERITGVKPSFRWMMYRCGYARKPGQERVLRVWVSKAGFEEALSRACLSSAREQGVEQAEWPAFKQRYPVRVQWDPERSLTFEPLPWRSIQVGLSGPAVEQYVDEWIQRIEDVTALAQQVGELVDAGRMEEDAELLPDETHYPASEPWASQLRLSGF